MAPPLLSKVPLLHLLTLTLAWQGSSAAAVRTLNVAHVNDIHAHFDQVNEDVGRCHEEQAEAGECYGGMSR